MVKAVKKVKLSEVAAECGLSVTAVSSILSNNKKYKVPDATREKVFAAAKKLNYHPNRAARSLITRKHFTVGLLFYSIKDRCYSEIMAEIQNELAKRQYASLFAFWKDSTVKESINFLLAHGVDGIITIASKDDLKEIMVPTIPVPIIYYASQLSGCDGVMVDRALGLRKLLSRAFEQGITKFGYLGNLYNETRCNELLNFLTENKLEKNDSWIITTANDLEAREEGMRKLLSNEFLPELLICQNDITAMIALQMAQMKNVSIPEAMEIVGFDNLYESRYTLPALSTMDIQIKRTAFDLVDIFFERMNDPERPFIIRNIEPQYICRNSTNI